MSACLATISLSLMRLRLSHRSGSEQAVHRGRDPLRCEGASLPHGRRGTASSPVSPSTSFLVCLTSLMAAALCASPRCTRTTSTPTAASFTLSRRSCSRWAQSIQTPWSWCLSTPPPSVTWASKSCQLAHAHKCVRPSKTQTTFCVWHHSPPPPPLS